MTEIRKFDWGAVASGSSKTKTRAKPETKDEPKSNFYPRYRARLNTIPDSEELARRISDALTALSKGVYWDRGSIVNIVL